MAIFRDSTVAVDNLEIATVKIKNPGYVKVDLQGIIKQVITMLKFQIY